MDEAITTRNVLRQRRRANSRNDSFSTRSVETFDHFYPQFSSLSIFLFRSCIYIFSQPKLDVVISLTMDSIRLSKLACSIVSSESSGNWPQRRRLVRVSLMDGQFRKIIGNHVKYLRVYAFIRQNGVTIFVEVAR